MKSRRQAIAIGLSQARQRGGKAPLKGKKKPLRCLFAQNVATIKSNIIAKGGEEMNKYLLIAVLGVVLVGGIIFVQSRSPQAPLEPVPVPGSNVTETVVEESASPSAAEENVVAVTVAGSPFQFVPNEIRAKKGDTVRITFKNESGSHDLTLPGFNVATKQLSAGSQETVEFVADKIGTFEFYCSVAGHKEDGMVGTLIVE
ncbi:MAG: cupredoxin domain-containing protein [Candidatus Levybacteria bacterium]|nr:cupredoxin domain-containing protein [Candidatus Levybacteria bacterium]